MFKYLITQKVFILVVEARPSIDGLDPPLAPNISISRIRCENVIYNTNVFLNLVCCVRILRSSLSFTFASLKIANRGAFTTLFTTF